jgi:hypothetical protein
MEWGGTMGTGAGRRLRPTKKKRELYRARDRSCEPLHLRLGWLPNRIVGEGADTSRGVGVKRRATMVEKPRQWRAVPKGQVRV